MQTIIDIYCDGTLAMFDDIQLSEWKAAFAACDKIRHKLQVKYGGMNRDDQAMRRLLFPAYEQATQHREKLEREAYKRYRLSHNIPEPRILRDMVSP